MYIVFVADNHDSLAKLDALKFKFQDKEQAISFAEMMLRHNKLIIFDFEIGESVPE